MKRLRHTAACGLVLLAGHAARASGPPPPTEPPELYVRLQYLEPGGAALDVHARIQYARPDSLDLVRWQPGAARLPRLEACFAAERLVLHPRVADPERYRVQMPRGAPLELDYRLELGRSAGVPHVIGPDYLCVWLGSALLAPHVPAPVDTAAVARLLLGTTLLPKWRVWGPWPSRAGLFCPATLDDLVDNFLALGDWRVQQTIIGGAAAVCTLQVALAGVLPGDDAAWQAAAARALRDDLGAGGRVLVCVAPTPGPARVIAARGSRLVLWPERQTALPQDEFWRRAVLPRRAPP